MRHQLGGHSMTLRERIADWISGGAFFVYKNQARVHHERMHYYARKMDEANARLIAADPDMLEALRVAREVIVSQECVHFNKISGPGHTFDAWLSDNEALSVIDAEIARATGEKP